MTKQVATLRSRLSPLEICKQNGWGIGTRLVGDEGSGPSIIQITGMGERTLLARMISHNGENVRSSEGSWVLYCREWEEVTA